MLVTKTYEGYDCDCYVESGIKNAKLIFLNACNNTTGQNTLRSKTHDFLFQPYDFIRAISRSNFPREINRDET